MNRTETRWTGVRSAYRKAMKGELADRCKGLPGWDGVQQRYYPFLDHLAGCHGVGHRPDSQDGPRPVPPPSGTGIRAAEARLVERETKRRRDLREEHERRILAALYGGGGVGPSFLQIVLVIVLPVVFLLAVFWFTR